MNIEIINGFNNIRCARDFIHMEQCLLVTIKQPCIPLSIPYNSFNFEKWPMSFCGLQTTCVLNLSIGVRARQTYRVIFAFVILASITTVYLLNGRLKKNIQSFYDEKINLFRDDSPSIANFLYKFLFIILRFFYSIKFSKLLLEFLTTNIHLKNCF